MISKIVDIEGKEFGANAPDYMYKEYLELPFDFTIQAISGTDLNKVRRVLRSYNDNCHKRFLLILSIYLVHWTCMK